MELEELSALVDEYTITRAQRISLDKDAARWKKRENELKDQLIHIMCSTEVNSVGGRTHRATRQRKTKPKAGSWGGVEAYVLETGDTAVFQRRLHEGHLRDLEADGIYVPGVEWIEMNDLTVSKL